MNKKDEDGLKIGYWETKTRWGIEKGNYENDYKQGYWEEDLDTGFWYGNYSSEEEDGLWRCNKGLFDGSIIDYVFGDTLWTRICKVDKITYGNSKYEELHIEERYE